MRAAQIQSNLAQVRNQITQVINSKNLNKSVVLVAVSKTWPAEDIAAAYEAGHRDFGENYVNTLKHLPIQELVEKQRSLPKDIRWHFIGTLQSNKIPTLLNEITNLHSIHTIESVSKLEKVLKGFRKYNDGKDVDLRIPCEIYLQVNVSGEASKHGMKDTSELTTAITKYLSEEYSDIRSKVKLCGLMSIGEPNESTRDFAMMNKMKVEVDAVFKGKLEPLRLSMGMSGDYLEAVEAGSDVIRVGSLIFGSRQ